MQMLRDMQTKQVLQSDSFLRLGDFFCQLWDQNELLCYFLQPFWVLQVKGYSNADLHRYEFCPSPLSRPSGIVTLRCLRAWSTCIYSDVLDSLWSARWCLNDSVDSHATPIRRLLLATVGIYLLHNLANKLFLGSKVTSYISHILARRSTQHIHERIR